MNRALICACVAAVLASGCGVAAVGQKASLEKRAGHTTHVRLPYEVHITPTTMQAENTSIETGGDTWSARGYDLKTLIAQVYDVDVRRIELPDNGMADSRYDMTVWLPVEVDADVMQRLLEDALEKKFKVSIRPESRAMDVYVLSAPNGAGAGLHPHTFAAEEAGLRKLVADDSASQAGEMGGDSAGRITYMGKDCSGVSSGGITVEGGTLADFRRTLEPDLDRVLLDETNLDGSYDFRIANYANKDELFKLLQDQLGLVVTKEQRSVTVLSVRSTDPRTMQAQL